MYAAELICSTGVLGFHTFKLTLCIYNKLRSHAEILTNIDRVLGVTPQSKGHSTMSSAGDVEIMFRELSQRDVFSKIPGRYHSTFPNHPQNLLECLDMGELKRWMTKLVKKISNGQYLYDGPEIDSDQSGPDVYIIT